MAQELGNVTKACRVMGYNRQHFYEIRRNFQLYGADGLVDLLCRPGTCLPVIGRNPPTPIPRR